MIRRILEWNFYISEIFELYIDSSDIFIYNIGITTPLDHLVFQKAIGV